MTAPPTMRERLVRKARTLDRKLFFEINHDPGHAALILGSGRSGTTWVAEVIARECGSRMLFEPFHPLWSPEGERHLFLRPDASDPVFEARARKILSGRLRLRQMDQFMITRLASGRVAKDVHTTNLAPWFQENFPETPIVFAVRHPIATASSRLRGGEWYGVSDYLATAPGREDAERSPTSAWLPAYDEHSGDPEPLVRFVAEWCIENAYPLSRIDGDDAGIALTFYEDTVIDPVAELGRLIAFCGPTLAPRLVPDLDLGDARRPSAKDSFGTAAAAGRSNDWSQILSRWKREVPGDVAARCLRVVEDFGLGEVYGDDPMPSKQGVGQGVGG